MGFLTRAANEEEPDQNAANEELYEKLFPKIGRDFVYRGDLEKMLFRVMQLVDPLGLNPVNTVSDSEAKKRALEYKRILESGKDGSRRFKDLIDLDDEDELEDKMQDVS